jgi:hypothetical protein
MSKVMAGVGAIGIVVGLLLGFGVIPLAAVQTPCGTLNANFSVQSTTGANVTIVDQSTFTGAPPGALWFIGIDWGDNHGIDQQISVGATVSHFYASAGTYTITDVAGGKCWDQHGFYDYYQSYYSQNVTANSSGGGGGNVHLSYGTTTYNLDLTVNDQTTVTGTAKLTALSFDWGDGSSIVRGLQPGFNQSHIYTTPGQYVVNEFATWTVNGNQPGSAQQKKTIDVKNGTTTQGGYGNITTLFTESSVATNMP